MDENLCDGAMSVSRCGQCQFLFKCIEINAKFKDLDEEVKIVLLEMAPAMPEGNHCCCCD